MPAAPTDRSIDPSSDEHAYVPLQDIPYRGHDLLARAVLGVTRPGDRIFEGGVSTGYFAKVLVDAGRVVDGAELDPEAAAVAEGICERVLVGDLMTLDLDGLPTDYAALVFGDTLEHLPDPPALLRRLKEHLRPGGHLVLSIPNIANWAIRLSLLAGSFTYRERGILDRTHLRFYTEKTLRAMLRDGGFEVVELKAAVPVPLVSNPTVGRLAHRVGNLRPSLFAYTFIVTAELRPS